MLANAADKYKSILSNAYFNIGLLLVFFPEVTLIYKLWIRPKYSLDPLSAFGLQIVFLLPFLVIAVLWHRIERQMNKEEISPSFAENLGNSLLILLIVVYSAFSLFLNLVPR